MGQTVHTRVIVRAADILGGLAALRLYVGAEDEEVLSWLNGATKPPQPVFEKLVALILEAGFPPIRRPGAEPASPQPVASAVSFARETDATVYVIEPAKPKG